MRRISVCALVLTGAAINSAAQSKNYPTFENLFLSFSYPPGFDVKKPDDKRVAIRTRSDGIIYVISEASGTYDFPVLALEESRAAKTRANQDFIEKLLVRHVHNSPFAREQPITESISTSVVTGFGIPQGCRKEGAAYKAEFRGQRSNQHFVIEATAVEIGDMLYFLIAWSPKSQLADLKHDVDVIRTGMRVKTLDQDLTVRGCQAG